MNIPLNDLVVKSMPVIDFYHIVKNKSESISRILAEEIGLGDQEELRLEETLVIGETIYFFINWGYVEQ